MSGHIGGRIVFALVLGLAAGNTVAERCVERRTLYIHVDTADETLGLNGETQSDFLDRTYGKGRWEIDRNAMIRITPPSADDAPIRIAFADHARSRVQQADLIVEARLDYLDASDRRTVVYGHRHLASYRFEPGTIPMLSVPQGVFKEPGALLVVAQVVNPGAATGTVRRVQQLAVSTAGCERHVYVRNRFTAIRLNRSQDRAPN